MKINCGPTPLERESALQQWHRWFAWKPVRVGTHDCRWLETVERRRELIGGTADPVTAQARRAA